MNMVYGFKASKIDGTEYPYKEVESMDIPERYSLDWALPEVLNQGSKPICVPCSLSSWLNWDINLEDEDNTGKDNHIDLNQIFDVREDKDGEGMTFKEAFHFLRHEGVRYDGGVKKIGRYCKIGSIIQLKQAIILNGPCFGALRVYNETSEFWIKMSGDSLLGGHAIALVGYDKDGFIIRNSWGQGFGDKGYTRIPYEDFGEFLELWCIVE